jgi:hypothetical protein
MRRLIAIVCLAALALTAFAGPAAAGGPVTAVDPKGDGVGPGDVRAVRISQTNDVLKFRVRTEKPLNLAAAPAWHRHGSSTMLRFFLETDPAWSGPDWVIRLRGAIGSELDVALVQLVQHAPRDGCIPSVYQPQPTIIEAAIASGCLSGNGTVRAYASYRFDQGGNGSIDSIDRAPNAGFGPQLNIVL